MATEQLRKPPGEYWLDRDEDGTYVVKSDFGLRVPTCKNRMVANQILAGFRQTGGGPGFFHTEKSIAQRLQDSASVHAHMEGIDVTFVEGNGFVITRENGQRFRVTVREE